MSDLVINESSQSNFKPVDVVIGFCKQLERHYSHISKSNDSAQTRLVWFVAIAGFGLLNSRSFSKEILGHEIVGCDLIILASPWAIAGILGIASHWILGEFTTCEGDYHMWRLNQYSFITTNSNTATSEQVNAFIEETESANPEAKISRDRLYPWAKGTERATFVFLSISFLATVVYTAVLLWI